MLIARDIFALLTAAAGWHYLLFSGAAQRLQSVEAQRNHQVRVLLRRFNGIMLMAMAMLFFIGSQPWLETRPMIFLADWASVMLLLLGIIVCALIDVRLTMKLKARRQFALKSDETPLGQ